MEFFPELPTREQTVEFVQRMQAEYSSKRHCYFAVDELATGEFIGFIGLSRKTFPADFTPCVDVGWRLSQLFWGKGYATEGARRCLQFAFNDLKLDSVKAIAPVVNTKSIRVMQKIEMQEISEFRHPLLEHDSWLQPCVLYAATPSIE